MVMMKKLISRLYSNLINRTINIWQFLAVSYICGIISYLWFIISLIAKDFSIRADFIEKGNIIVYGACISLWIAFVFIIPYIARFNEFKNVHL